MKNINTTNIVFLILGVVALVVFTVHWGIQFYDLSQLIFGLGISFGLFFVSYIIYRFNKIENNQKEYETRLTGFASFFGQKEFE